MANYLCVFPAPDAHIDYIKTHPASLDAYVEGELPLPPQQHTVKPTLWQRITGSTPAPSPTVELPTDWPTGELTMIGPEINHRNVDLFHLILNGTTDFVTGSGSIFQTWLQSARNNTHSAIDLTDHNEHFAFYSKQLPDLAALTAAVDTNVVKARFIQWLRSNGDDYIPSDVECDTIAEEFAAFTAAIQGAISKSHGLIWVSR